jgi:hypothetical protein
LSTLIVIAASSCVAPANNDLPDASSPMSYLPTAPEAPAPPSSPVLTPCPTGWAETGQAATACEPWPTGRSVTCAADQAQWPGDSSCSPVGAGCPQGDWPEGLPANRAVLYVRAGAAPGGTGAQTAPYATVSAAVAAASPGTIIAVAKGAYSNEQVVMTNQVSLWGACAAQVKLAASVFDNASAVVNVVGPGNVVRNVTVSAARPAIWVEGATAALEVHGVVVDQATLAGVLVRSGAHLSGDELVIRQTLPQPSTGVSGRGLSVEAGASATLQRVLLEHNTDYGALVMESGTSLTLLDAAIIGTASRVFDGRVGQGVGVFSGATATLTRTVLEANHECGLLANGGHISATDVVVRDSAPSSADPDTGFGVVVINGGSAVFQRTLVERNLGYGLFAEGTGVEVELTDVVVRDTAASGPGIEGGAVGVTTGAQGTLQRVALERNVAFGLTAQGDGTRITATDLWVLDTLPETHTRNFGIGLEVSLDAGVTVERVLVLGSHTTGVMADRAGQLTLSDAEVRGTLPAAVDDEGGIGLSVQEGARADAKRVLLVGNRTAGLLVSEQDTQLTVTDLVVRDTAERLHQGDLGHGVQVQTSAHATIERAILENNLSVGLMAQFAQVTASDLVIRNTGTSACAVMGCPNWGEGLGAFDRASVGVERFLITHNALMGAQFGSQASLDLAVGEVSWNTIGIAIQATDYDLSRLEREVSYLNNGNKLSADVVPLPSEPIKLSPTQSPR